MGALVLAPIHGPPQKRRKTVRTVSALMVTRDADGAAVPATDLRIGGPGDHRDRRLTLCVCMFITAGPMIKLCAGAEGDSEGHVL